MVSRLFDLFLVSHPLAPLYVGAAALVQMRELLLIEAAGDDLDGTHRLLSGLPGLADESVGHVARRALEFMKAVPPEALMGKGEKEISEC